MNENGNLPLAGIVVNNFGTLDPFHGTNIPTEVAAHFSFLLQILSQGSRLQYSKHEWLHPL
jgi:hypothetical protein